MEWQIERKTTNTCINLGKSSASCPLVKVPLKALVARCTRRSRNGRSRALVDAAERARGQGQGAVQRESHFTGGS